jgi:peptidoglycan/LPS O-acetylase OafA/YrhL
LIHQFAGYSIMNTYFTAADRWWAICITTLLMVAISSLSYVYFDIPIRAKLRKIANIQIAQKVPPPAIPVSSIPE